MCQNCQIFPLIDITSKLPAVMYCLSHFCCFCFRNEIKLKLLHETACGDATLLEIAKDVMPEIVSTTTRSGPPLTAPFLPATVRNRPRFAHMRGLREALRGHAHVPPRLHAEQQRPGRVRRAVELGGRGNRERRRRNTRFRDRTEDKQHR